MPNLNPKHIVVLGAGLAGCCTALSLARKGFKVSLFDRHIMPMNAASLHNEGKLHLGYVYAASSDAETSRVMIKGSSVFIGILEELTGIPASYFKTSIPFTYSIPQDSQLSMEDISNHFVHVDEEIKTFYDSGNPYLRGVKPTWSDVIDRPKWIDRFNPDVIQGCIQTEEISLDTVQVANVVSAAVMSEDNIVFHDRAEITHLTRESDGTFKIIYQQDNEEKRQQFIAGVNCLWEERIKFDKTLGIEPPRPNLTRFKSTVTFYQDGFELSKIPSTTMILGPYGDVVNYNNGLIYLSWYPVCKLGQSEGDKLDELKARFKETKRGRFIRENIKALSTFVPAVAQLEAIAGKGKVGGGFICAWGQSDITDPKSGLHARGMIGPEVHGNWVSINTGKYCTAPLFGLEAAQLIAERL